MSEIKRYKIETYNNHADDWVQPIEDPQGEWVRWEDVKAIIKEASKSRRDNNPPPWYYGSPSKGGADG